MTKVQTTARTLRAVGCARVSMRRQADHEVSLDEPQQKISAYCVLKHATVIARTASREWLVVHKIRDTNSVRSSVGSSRRSRMPMPGLGGAIEAGLADLGDHAFRQGIQTAKGFTRKARERILLNCGGRHRDHLRALAQRAEADDDEVRIMASKSELL